MKRNSVYLFLFLMLAAVEVLADCRYNGKDYQIGTVIDGLVCTQSGWRKL